MNRYDADSSFDDLLGSRLRYALRRSVAKSAPSAEVWARIKQQVYEGEAGAEPLLFAARQGRLRRVSGRLLAFSARTLRLLDEHTMSSETVWLPETEYDVRQRLALQCISLLPLCGQMLATY